MKNPLLWHINQLPRFGIALLTVSASIAAQADQAIVVGINKYPGLDSSSQLLGAAADAEAIAQALRSRGFRVKLVTDSQATEAGIRAAIAAAAGQAKSNERFVFYFAGHGWRNKGVPGHAAIVPYDANRTPNTLEVTNSELASWIKAVPSSAKTVILDSCFSGAMTGSRSLGLGRARSLEHPASYGRTIGYPSDARDLLITATKVASSETTFVAACGPEQLAYERALSNGKVRGLFSSYLESEMGRAPKLWADALTPTSSKVTYDSRSLQSPMIFPATANSMPFLGQPGNVPKPSPSVSLASLWDQISASAPSPEALEISSSPGQTAFRIGDQFKIGVKPKVSGYLVIFNKGTSGKYYVRFPENLSGSADAVTTRAFVASNQSVLLPDGNNSFEGDQAGTEQLKAALYTDKAEFLKVAAAIIGATNGSSSRSFEASDARDLQVKPTKVTPGKSFYTAGLQITIDGAVSGLYAAFNPQPISESLYSTGWNPSTKKELEASDKLLPLKSRNNLPTKVMLTQYLSPVASQGGQGSCTAWALGYYAYGYGLNSNRRLSAEKLIDPQFQVSSAFIYNQVNGGKDEGSSFYSVAMLLKQKGAASMKEMPYNDKDFKLQPNAEAIKRAEIDKAIEAFSIGKDSKFIVDQVRTYLAEVQLPVVFGMTTYLSFHRAPSTPGFVYQGPTGPKDEKREGHALCIVGYDDEKKAFRVVNSWGKDWADKGFIWISYAHLAAAGRDDIGIMPGGVFARASSEGSSFKIVRGKKQ